ncbi:MAG: DUF2309 domain-containing protein [Deltaproteobacteria bacterium]|nr:DUF2309 domain-containing protein [Deltaproteobacteria bacterium]
MQWKRQVEGFPLNDAQRQRLREIVAHAGHLLPGQGPMRTFIHHNTLHGLQHLAFDRALAEAEARSLGSGYLSLSEFRAHYLRGRIADRDVDAALIAAGVTDPEQRRLRLQIMLHEPLVLPRQTWASDAAIDTPPVFDDGPAVALSPAQHDALEAALTDRAASAAEGVQRALARRALADLEKGCLGREGFTALATLASLDAGSVSAKVYAELERHDPREAMRRYAQRQVAATFAGLSRGETLGGLVRALTGEDIEAAIDERMIELLQAFCDEGLAAWAMPHREHGFFSAWRTLKGDKLALSVRFDAGGLLAEWPLVPADAVIYGLRLLGVDEAAWGAYLTALLVRLRGFGGMIAWRASQKAYARQQKEPIDLVELLAVRLFYEVSALQRACAEHWHEDAEISALRAYFSRRSHELLVRQELFAGRLPEPIAEDARTLIESKEAPYRTAAKWLRLADTLWAACDPAVRAELASGESRENARRTAAIALAAKRPESELSGEVAQFSRDAQRAIWQRAYEINYRDAVLAALQGEPGPWHVRERRPAAQVVFCIDEREEGFRRHLEELDREIETLGAAGFFGVAMYFRGAFSESTDALCPVVVEPVHLLREQAVDARAFARAGFVSGWKKLLFDIVRHAKNDALVGAVVTHVAAWLALVPLVGALLFPRAARRAISRLEDALAPPVVTTIALDAKEPVEHEGGLRAGFSLDEQADRVEGTLRNVGLFGGPVDVLARLVVLCAHGSSSVNNPHLSAYDCGACGGKHGGPNARAFARMANHPGVRERLRTRGLALPTDTWFVSAEHNTCSEEIVYFDVDRVPPGHAADLARLRTAMDAARERSAHERCRRFVSASLAISAPAALRHVEARALDPSQARPELGHATNASCLVGRRSLAAGRFFDRRLFLVSYDPRTDSDGRILERILLAVGPVGAGISLEYYFSTVDPLRYGCDTKLAHNISGLVGVVEGARSDLRTGLPRQMTEIHEPMRLLLIVEAKPAVLGAIYERQPPIKELVGNGWVQLAVVDPDTRAISVFVEGQGFVDWKGTIEALPTVARSRDWYANHRDFLPPCRVTGGVDA